MLERLKTEKTLFLNAMEKNRCKLKTFMAFSFARVDVVDIKKSAENQIDQKVSFKIQNVSDICSTQRIS